MSFYDYLKEASKKRLKLAILNDAISKKEMLNAVFKLNPFYNCGIIIGINLLLRYGKDISHLIADVFRLEMKSILLFPMNIEFLNKEAIRYISSLGIDAIIVEPSIYKKIDMIKELEKEGLETIPIGFMKGGKGLNVKYKKLIIEYKPKVIFTIEASEKILRKLRMDKETILINFGSARADIEVEILRT